MDSTGNCERTFHSFASLLTVVPPSSQTGASDPAVAPQPVMQDKEAAPQCLCAATGARLLAEATLLRVATYEACERACRLTVRRLAQEVLARELQLAPVALDRLVAHALRQLGAEEPLELAVAPGDGACVNTGLRIVEDPALRSGDLVVRVKDGSVDARLQVRLATVLDRPQPPIAARSSTHFARSA